MLPAVDGKRVADLGCGFGWASRASAREFALVPRTGGELRHWLRPVGQYIVAQLHLALIERFAEGGAEEGHQDLTLEAWLGWVPIDVEPVSVTAQLATL